MLQLTVWSWSHSFLRFSTWCSLIQALASLIHVVKSFKGKEEYKGWHLCEKSCILELVFQAKSLIIESLQRLQREAYKVELSCLQNGQNISRGSCLWKQNPFISSDGLMRMKNEADEAFTPWSGETTTDHSLLKLYSYSPHTLKS